MATIIGQEVASNSPKRSQVYWATHRGDERLPYMNRSFISFSFGGKLIEDFELIATMSGDRLDRRGYAEFEDTVSTYDNLDGQHYWATHYKANQMDFQLSTDGIDQKMLDDFLYWFRPGICKELILAEHPNRAIMARVSEPPTLNLLPFEGNVSVKIGTATYNTKTTLYRGDIDLSLVMDQPFWYSKQNILGIRDDSVGHERYIDQWIDQNGQQISIFASQDALKILYEDGIPLGSAIQTNMLLGNGTYAHVEDTLINRIWNPSLSGDDSDLSVIKGARVQGSALQTPQTAVIAGAIMDINGDGIASLGSGEYGYFYYAGTAPANTIIRFTIQPEFDSNGYIKMPYNKYSKGPNNVEYNYIKIESTKEQYLKITTPNFYTSYNRLIWILRKMIGTNLYTWENVIATIRDQVFHKRIRQAAIKIININKDSENCQINGNETLATMTDLMKTILTINNTLPVASFEFNSETGEAKGSFQSNYTGIMDNNDTNDFEEDVGDMLLSNYIVIKERNYPDENGQIRAWTVGGNKTASHAISHNFTSPITNFSIYYKNMYL